MPDRLDPAGARWLGGALAQSIATAGQVRYASLITPIYVQSPGEPWVRTVLLQSFTSLPSYAEAASSNRDSAVFAQIAAIEVAPPTRARARDLVQQLLSRGLRVNRATTSPEGGITLHATGSRPASYASIDVDDDDDVIIGVSDADGVRMLDTEDEGVALDEIATFLRRT